MKELEMQRLVVKAVRAAGGAAHKLSHRHLVGICDLIVKLPKLPALLLEAKLSKFSPRVSRNHQFVLAVTYPQQAFLAEYQKAGMIVGVLSGVAHMRGPSLLLACFHLDRLVVANYSVMVADHTVDGRSPLAICQLLKEFIDGAPH
jgi:hypothetical protein